MDPISKFGQAPIALATEMAESSRDAKALEDFKNEALKLNDLNEKDRAEKVMQLETAAKDFESMFIHMLFKQMRATLPKTDFFGASKAEEIFTDMKDIETSKGMAEAGGLGLAPILVAQLKNQL